MTPGSSIGDLYWDDELVPLRHQAEWRIGSVEGPLAHDGIVINESTNIILKTTEIEESTQSELGVMVFEPIRANAATVYVQCIGAYENGTAYDYVPERFYIMASELLADDNAVDNDDYFNNGGLSITSSGAVLPALYTSDGRDLDNNSFYWSELWTETYFNRVMSVLDGNTPDFRITCIVRSFAPLNSQSGTSSFSNTEKIVLADGIQFLGDIANYATTQTGTLIGISNDTMNYTLSNEHYGELASLQEINVPNSCRGIVAGMFKDCIALTTVTLPQTCKIIGAEAFAGSSITSISGTAVTTIHSDAFNGCGSLTTVDFPRLSTWGPSGDANLIYSGYFSFCSNLQTATLPKITSIPTDTFNGCSSLNFNIPDSVTEIAGNAFYNVASISYSSNMTATGGPTWGANNYTII